MNLKIGGGGGGGGERKVEKGGRMRGGRDFDSCTVKGHTHALGGEPGNEAKVEMRPAHWVTVYHLDPKSVHSLGSHGSRSIPYVDATGQT